MSHKKKVFLEAHNLKNFYTGFGQFNYWLIKHLSSENDRYKLYINSKSEKALENFHDDVAFHKYHSLSRHKIFRTRKKFDLWHSLNQNSKIEPYYDQPYLLSFHDVIFLEKDRPEDVDPKKLKLLKEKVERSNAIAFISEHARKSANEYLEIPKSTYQTVIYNGNPVVALDKPAPKPDLSFPIGKPFLFCIGQFLEMKNFHSLVGMLSELKDYQLILAGNNNKAYAEVVRKEIEKYNLKDRVFLPGKISDLEKHFYLQNCEAFLFPSLFEGFGLPPIEAMAYGKPVFLANRTSLPEIAGELGFYWENFEPDSMAEVFKSGMHQYMENSLEYKSRLQKRARFFDWRTTAKHYLDLYDMLMETK